MGFYAGVLADGSELIVPGARDGLIRSWDWRTGGLWARRAVSVPYSAMFDLTAGRRWLIALGMETLQATECADRNSNRPGVEDSWATLMGSGYPGRRPPGHRWRIIGDAWVIGFDLEKILDADNGSNRGLDTARRGYRRAPNHERGSCGSAQQYRMDGPLE